MSLATPSRAEENCRSGSGAFQPRCDLSSASHAESPLRYRLPDPGHLSDLNAGSPEDVSAAKPDPEPSGRILHLLRFSRKGRIATPALCLSTVRAVSTPFPRVVPRRTGFGKMCRPVRGIAPRTREDVLLIMLCRPNRAHGNCHLAPAATESSADCLRACRQPDRYPCIFSHT